MVSGMADKRYRFTEKERDTETGCDYFVMLQLEMDTEMTQTCEGMPRQIPCAKRSELDRIDTIGP